MNHFISTLLAIFTISISGAKADWMNFRGPNGTGITSECAQLTTDLSTDKIAWKTKLPGRGLGSPVIIGDRVFITAASGLEQKQLHILCFSSRDGKQLWERKLWATGRTMCHKKTCVAAPTPASDGKFIYAFYSSNDLVAVDLDGNIQWMRGLTLDYPNASNSLGMASSPIVADDTLVVQVENDSESFAAGIDLSKGTNRWKIDRPKAANWTSPVLLEVGGETVAALQSSKGIHGVHPTTGSSLFEYTNGASTTPSSVTIEDRIYIPSHGLTALKIANDGSAPTKLWNETAQRPGTASPLIVGKQIYTINTAGVLTCADLATGERKWRMRLKGPFNSSPVTNGSHIYIFSEAGLGQCVELGETEGKIVSEIDLNETILATASLADDSLYIRSDGQLWKFQ